MGAEVIQYEQAAEVKDVRGWVCKTCRRFWGIEEHMARYCCCTERPCETSGCSGRVEKGYVHCGPCRDANDKAAWLKLIEVPWDGEALLFEEAGNKYFRDVDDIEAYLEAHSGMKLSDLHLVICEREEAPSFDVDEFLCDYLPEDTTCDDAEEINKIVNDWLEANAPESWLPGSKRPTLESIEKVLRAYKPSVP
jgi:hypothetical protein